MITQQFIDNYNFCPYSLDEFAHGLTKITDSDELVKVGQAYLDAVNDLMKTLDKIGVELG